MIIILSPSKTQDFENINRASIHTYPEFILDTKELLKAIQEKEINELQEVMQISERLAFLNYNRFQDIQLPFNPEHDRQAIVAFRGDVYEGLDVDTLADEELHFAQTNLRIISGFYGVLRPLDLIQPYRLEMKTPLETKRGKNLYQFWGKFLTDYFNTRYPNEVLINLASQGYARAVMNRHFKLKSITPVFKEKKNGELKVMAVYTKKARGKMARFIVQNRIKQSQELKYFEEDEYKFDEKLSSETEWVFTRPLPKRIEQSNSKEIKKRGRKPKKVTNKEEE